MLLEPLRRLSFPLLEQAAALMLVHHDALRTRFASDATGWRQWQSGLRRIERCAPMLT